MTRSTTSLIVALTFGGASVAHAAVNVSGTIYSFDASPVNILRSYDVGPLNSLSHGVTYEKQGLTESLWGDVASGGGPGFVFSRSFAQYSLYQADPNPGDLFFRGNAAVDARWSDIVVSGPAGPARV